MSAVFPFGPTEPGEPDDHAGWYRNAWVGLTLMLGIVGAVVAVLNTSAAEVVCAAIAGITMAVIYLALLHRSWVRSLSVWVTAAILAAVSAVAAVGWCIAIDNPGLVLAGGVALIVGHPAVVSRCVRRVAQLTSGLEADTSSVPAALSDVRSVVLPQASALDDVGLCRSWRMSYWALEQARQQSDPHVTLGLIELRQSYLDAMEQRHRHGFRRWLLSGPRATSDPTRYIVISEEKESAGD